MKNKVSTSTSVTATAKIERQLQVGTNNSQHELANAQPSLVRSRIQFFSSSNESTDSELPFVVVATEKEQQEQAMKEDTQLFSFGTKEQSTDVSRGTANTETHSKGVMIEIEDKDDDPLDVGRGGQLSVSQESLMNSGKLTMSSSDISFSTFQKMDSASFFVRGRSATNCEELESVTEKPQVPELKLPESTEAASLLEALRSEPKVTNPDLIYNKAVERLNTLKEDGTHDRYILSDEETATLCVIPLLMKAGFDFSDMVDSCQEKLPSKLFVLLLKSLRKLPQTRDIFCFGETSTKLAQRAKGSYLQRNFVVASKSMQAVKESLEKKGGHCKEILCVEGGWGYERRRYCH